MSMEWPTDKIFRLIDGYKKFPVLWDTSDKFFRVLNRKMSAWSELARYVGCEDIDEVKKKMNSLLASYRRERHNEKYRSSGDAVYRSTWFAYDCFDFLNDKYHPKKKKAKKNDDHDDDIIEIEVPIQEEDESQSTASPPEPAPKPEKVETRHFSHLHAERSAAAKTHFISPLRADALVKRPFNKHGVKNVEICTKHRSQDDDKDEFSAYGNYVAVKLRAMDTRTRLMVQHAINNVLFEADIGKYNVPLEYVLQSSDAQAQQFISPSQISKRRQYSANDADNEDGHILDSLREANILS